MSAGQHYIRSINVLFSKLIQPIPEVQWGHRRIDGNRKVHTLLRLSCGDIFNSIKSYSWNYLHCIFFPFSFLLFVCLKVRGRTELLGKSTEKSPSCLAYRDYCIPLSSYENTDYSRVWMKEYQMCIFINMDLQNIQNNVHEKKWTRIIIIQIYKKILRH